jgi:hypothetical protein
VKPGRLHLGDNGPADVVQSHEAMHRLEPGHLLDVKADVSARLDGRGESASEEVEVQEEFVIALA